MDLLFHWAPPQAIFALENILFLLSIVFYLGVKKENSVSNIVGLFTAN